MAATPLTFLRQIQGTDDLTKAFVNRPENAGKFPSGTTSTLEQFKHALNFSRIGDAFEWDDWYDFVHANTLERLQELAKEFEPKYVNYWNQYGQPSTCEDWMKAKYPPAEINALAEELKEFGDDDGA